MSRLDFTHEEALEASQLWWLIVLLGVASSVAGVILVFQPSNSLATLAVVVGIFLLIDGIIELIRSFGRGENKGLAAIVGVLGIVVGIALIRHPFHGVAAIGLLIGIWLVAAGVIRLVRAIVVGVHAVLGVVIALIEVVAGIVIVSDPHIGYTALAVITGISLILNGIGLMAAGVVVRSVKSELTGSGSGVP